MKKEFACERNERNETKMIENYCWLVICNYTSFQSIVRLSYFSIFSFLSQAKIYLIETVKV